MSDLAVALLLFGSAFALLVSGIPIWAGLAGISLIFVMLCSAWQHGQLRAAGHTPVHSSQRSHR